MLIMWQVAEAAQVIHRGGLPYVGIRRSSIALGSKACAIIQDFVLTLDGTAAVEASFGRRRLAVGVLRTVEELADSEWSRQRNASAP